MNNSLVKTRMRLLITYLSIAFIFILLIVRLFVVCIIDSDFLVKKGNEQWYRDLPLRADRGEITDRNGNVIVGNQSVYTVYLRPRSVSDARGVAHSLAVLLELDESKLYEKITSASVGEITAKKNVPEHIGKQIQALNLDGVYLTSDSKRDYPYSEFLAQVVGYTNIDNAGQNGLEGYYDKLLKGVDGKLLITSDNRGSEISPYYSYLPSIKGASLGTTIDINIQAFCENAVKIALEQWNCKRASMIVMDVNDGGVVAMCSAPTYDLNNLPRHDINMLNAYSKNSMIVDVYEPGSTFKIFTTALALEYGVVSENKTFFCPGYRIVDGQRIKCWRSKGHSSQNLAEGVMNSCNCVFMDLALSLGVEKFYKGLKTFGFGQKTGIDFFGESNGLLMNEKNVKNVDLARIGFGQAVAVTPIQLLSGVCSVVNGGYSVTPHFATEISDTYGNILYKFENSSQRILSESTSKKMRELLENVVSKGSGKKASVQGYRIGGKTGTAQKYANGVIAQGKYVSSFVGFAPADNPKYAILMIVDEPASYAYYGSIVAAPSVSNVFSRIFEYEKIKPEMEENIEYVTMPNIEGMSYNDAVKLLKQLSLNFEVEGDGDVILSALPLLGEQIPKGDVVLLRT